MEAVNKDKQINTILQAYFVGLHLATCLDDVKDTQFYKHELKQLVNRLDDTLVRTWNGAFSDIYNVGEQTPMWQYIDKFYAELMGLDLNDFWRACGVVKLAKENPLQFRSICAAMGIKVIDNSNELKQNTTNEQE